MSLGSETAIVYKSEKIIHACMRTGHAHKCTCISFQIYVQGDYSTVEPLIKGTSV